jgi:glycosyltransferase involved in cell wall biosynthesis
MKALKNKTIQWVTSDRFDTKPDKSTWVEVGDSLGRQGATVNIITSFKKEAYFPAGKAVEMVYLRVLDIPLLYRLFFSLAAYFWLKKNASRDDVVMLNPHELWMKPLLALSRFKNVHLDVRTLPINRKSLKSRVDNFLFWRLAMTFFGKRCHSYSFITDRLKSAVEQEFGHRYDDYVIWQSGVNTDFFSEVLATTEEQKPDHDLTLFYHGSLYQTRGVDTLLRAYACLPETLLGRSRLLVVGGGNGLASLQALAEELGVADKIEFRGLVPYEEIPLHIQEADFCVCPLPDLPEWNVSSPLKVLEYMACAKPIVLTPIPSHQDILADESFVVWTKGDDVEDFVVAFLEAVERLQDLKDKASAAKVLVRQNWDWQAHGERFGKYLADRYAKSA